MNKFKRFSLVLLLLSIVFSTVAWNYGDGWTGSKWTIAKNHWGSFNSWKTPTDIPSAEATALKDLYDNTDGANWTNNTNWGTSATANDWYGITVTAGHVTAVELPNNALNGSPSTYVPTTVVTLDLGQNTSMDAPDLSSNTALTSVDIAGCDFTENEVDTILATVEGFSTSSGSIDLGGSNAVPSLTGLADSVSLVKRSWTSWYDDFVFTVETTGAAETFTIPCQNNGTFNATVDWGDSSTSTITAYDDADLAHEYAAAGTYIVRISGTFPNIYFNNGGDKTKIKTVEQLGKVGWTRLNNAFFGCSALTKFVGGNTDTSSVTTMSNMMSYWTSMTSTPDLTSFDTSSVTNMSGMLRDWLLITSPPDLTSFDTSSVTDMSYMMYNWVSMTSPPDLTSFDTSLVTTMANMMRSWPSMGSIGDIGVSSFNITSLTDATSMASGTTFATAAYDAILVAWEAQEENTDVTIHFGASTTYTAGGAAEAAHNALVANGWIITDGGSI